MLFAGVASALTVSDLKVGHDDGHYQISATLSVAAPRAEVYRAATDFEALPRFNPSIKSTERIGHNELKSIMHLCAGFFCKTLTQVMRYRLRAPDAIDMQVVPEAGDLKSGFADWRFAAVGPRQTRMRFKAAIEPDFWVPPFVGPFLINRGMRRQVRVTGRAIEQLAAQYAHDKTASHD